MKRCLLVAALALVSTAAFAQVPDHDVLVTPEGTVYTVDTQFPSNPAADSATSVIDMAVKNGSDLHHLVIPASMSAGYHFGGALAYDPDSKTLFVLWIHMPQTWGMTSEFLLASYRDGNWQPAVSIDSRPYAVRSNLRLGITRRVSQLQKDGTYADVPALILHAVWWDDSVKGEEARYVSLPIENGAVTESSMDIHSLEEYVPASDETYNAVGANFNAEILRHPAVVSSPMQSSVDVVFGDTRKNVIHSVTLHPIADARVHIPVGIGGGGPSRPRVLAPASFSSDWKGPVSVLSRGGRLVFANANEKSLSYIAFTNGTWTDVKSIAIDARFSAEAALAALDKMVSTQ